MSNVQHLAHAIFHSRVVKSPSCDHGVGFWRRVHVRTITTVDSGNYMYRDEGHLLNTTPHEQLVMLFLSCHLPLFSADIAQRRHESSDGMVRPEQQEQQRWERRQRRLLLPRRQEEEAEPSAAAPLPSPLPPPLPPPPPLAPPRQDCTPTLKALLTT